MLSPTEKWMRTASYLALQNDVQARNEAEARIRTNIARMRQQGCTWDAIAAALGVSKQAARQKYGSTRVSLEEQPLPVE